MSAPSIASSLTTVFNLSLSSGSFPDLWKKAKVSTLLKESSLFDRSNYRPISVFVIFSLRFLNVMFTFHFITFSPKMTCSPILSLASESLALASLLLVVLSIAF